MELVKINHCSLTLLIWFLLALLFGIGEGQYVSDLYNESIPKLLFATQGDIFYLPRKLPDTQLFYKIPLPTLNSVIQVNGLVHNPVDETLIICDSVLHTIYKYDLSTKQMTVLLERSGFGILTAIALDVTGQNLIFMEVSDKDTKVKIMSLHNRSITTVFETSEVGDDLTFSQHDFSIYVSTTRKDFVRSINVINAYDLKKVYTMKYYYRYSPMLLAYCSMSDIVIYTSQEMTYSLGVLPFKYDYSKFEGFSSNRVNIESICKLHYEVFITAKNESDILVVFTKDKYQYDRNFIIKQPLSSNSSRHSAKSRKVLAPMHHKLGDEIRLNHPCSPQNAHKRNCSHICMGSKVRGKAFCLCADGYSLNRDDNVSCSPTPKTSIAVTATTNLYFIQYIVSFLIFCSIVSIFAVVLYCNLIPNDIHWLNRDDEPIVRYMEDNISFIM